MKDNFSKQAHLYSQFCPTYPAEMFRFILSLVKNKTEAWDCGTGNGQVASVLAGHFEKVYATDISEKQLANAVQKPNITYKKEQAEHTGSRDRQFDLITVAQAIHWFDFGAFYKEVKRTLKPGGIFAVIGYPLFRADAVTDEAISDFYVNRIGPYWDKERRYLDEQYQTIPFPFKEIEAPVFVLRYSWGFEQLTGYLNTWSAVQHYIKQHRHNPVEQLAEKLKHHWEGREIQIEFPILLRIGIHG